MSSTTFTSSIALPDELTAAPPAAEAPSAARGPATRPADPAVTRALAGLNAGTVRGRFDAAQNDGVNFTHWTNADGLSAASANSPAVRSTLRNRSRYELANNSLAAGIVSTLANDTIGTGPRLVVRVPGRGKAGKARARQLEAAWAEWSAEAQLVEKLATMRRAKAGDGEVFALLTSNPLHATEALDLRLFEADQVATPDRYHADERSVDGIRYDRAGNPSEFHFLEHHPGDDRGLGRLLDYREIPADSVVHYFHATRPGELRGVPELTPALGLFAILRRYTLATLFTAENAAKISGVFESNHPDSEPAEFPEFSPIDLHAGTFYSLPEGWAAKGFKAEQPVTAFPEFRRAIVNEIARCLNMPLNVALGSSQDYNFASGRLDHGVYHAAIRVERRRIESRILARVFAAWLREATLLGRVPAVRLDQVAPEWIWPAFPSGDPTKDAQADAAAFEAGTRSLRRHYAERHGTDWRTELDQLEDERAHLEALGRRHPSDTSAPPPAPGTDAQGGGARADQEADA